MKIRVKTKFLFNNKVYEAGDVISSPPLSKNILERLLKIIEKTPYQFEIIEEKEKEKEKKKEKEKQIAKKEQSED